MKIKRTAEDCISFELPANQVHIKDGMAVIFRNNCEAWKIAFKIELLGLDEEEIMEYLASVPMRAQGEGVLNEIAQEESE